MDRFTSRLQEATVGLFTNLFLFADSLWESFQEKTNQFITQYLIIVNKYIYYEKSNFNNLFNLS